MIEHGDVTRANNDGSWMGMVPIRYRAISLPNVAVPSDRKFEEDSKLLEELYQDIKLNGQHTPILVTSNPDRKTVRDPDYVLIDGYHRLQVLHRLWQEEQEANPEWSPDVCNAYNVTVGYIKHIDEKGKKYIEIAANLHRRHLTKKEKEYWESERAKLSRTKGAVKESGAVKKRCGKGSASGTPFSQWYNDPDNVITKDCIDTNSKRVQAQKTWKRYQAATGVETTPGKASQEQVDAFVDWLGQQAAEALEKEKAIKAAGAAEADRLKVEAAKKDKQQALKKLEDLIKETRKKYPDETFKLLTKYAHEPATA